MLYDMDEMESGCICGVNVGTFDQLEQSKIDQLTAAIIVVVILNVQGEFSFWVSFI
jgi:hypothetical protein